METKSTKGPATRRPACYQVTLSAAKYRIAGEVRYNPMFEITPDDISLIGDEDLRTLVGLLCEAEARKRGLPTSTVTYGGDQNATDGGVDVRVTFPAGTAISGFVPREATG